MCLCVCMVCVYGVCVCVCVFMVVCMLCGVCLVCLVRHGDSGLDHQIDHILIAMVQGAQLRRVPPAAGGPQMGNPVGPI